MQAWPQMWSAATCSKRAIGGKENTGEVGSCTLMEGLMPASETGGPPGCDGGTY